MEDKKATRVVRHDRTRGETRGLATNVTTFSTRRNTEDFENMRSAWMLPRNASTGRHFSLQVANMTNTQLCYKQTRRVLNRDTTHPEAENITERWL